MCISLECLPGAHRPPFYYSAERFPILLPPKYSIPPTPTAHFRLLAAKLASWPGSRPPWPDALSTGVLNPQAQARCRAEHSTRAPSARDSSLGGARWACALPACLWLSSCPLALVWRQWAAQTAG